MTTPFDDPRDDDPRHSALAARLSGALRRSASEAVPPPDAWSRFQARLGHDGAALFETVSYDGYDDHLNAVPVVTVTAARAEWASEAGRRDAAVRTEPTSTLPARARPVAARAPRWRTPLVAAASVVVLAGGIAAVSTGLIGPGHGGATSAASAHSEGGDESATGTPVTDSQVEVPIACAQDGADPCPSPGGLTLRVTGTGTGSLHATLSMADAASVSGDTFGDGTPLGLLAAFSPTGDAATVYGAVRSEVAQLLAVLSAPPLLASGVDNPAYQTIPTQHWRFVSPDSTGTVQLDVEVHDAQFTSLPDGHRAWAVRVPVGLTVVDLTALDADGRVLQDRSLDLDTGQTSDLRTPETEGAPAALATMTGDLDPDRGVLAQIEGSRSAEAMQSRTESARVSASSETDTAALAERVQQAELQYHRAREKATAAQAALAGAEEAATDASSAVQATPADASDGERLAAEARSEQADTALAAARAQAGVTAALAQEAAEALDAALAAQKAAQGATPGGR